MSERDLMRQMDDATHAKALLENPLWQRINDEIKEIYFQKLVNCPARDREGRDIFLTQLKSLELLVGLINAKVEGGKAAKNDLERYSRTEGKVAQLARRFT